MRRRQRSLRPENELQRSVIAHLKTMGVPNLFVTYLRPRRIGDPAGSTETLPDLLIVHLGVAYFLELKADGGRISDAQHDAIHRLAMAGARTAIAFGLDHALEILERWKLLRRAAA